MSQQAGYQPRMLGIVCNWCCYGGADLCGVSRFQYPPHIRLVRVMCSARVDLLHVFHALGAGHDAVFVGGCHLCDCHYVTNGNFNAYIMVQVCKRMLKQLGILPGRLRLEWVSAGEGIRFAQFMNEYSSQVESMGPLGTAEGMGGAELAWRLEAARRIIPYAKLVLTQKLLLPNRTQEAYYEYFAGEEFGRLYDAAIAGPLTTSLILLLLRERPLSTAEVAARIGIQAAAASACLGDASKRGWVRFDANRGSYALC